MLSEEHKDIINTRIHDLQNSTTVGGFYPSLLLGGDGVSQQEVEEYVATLETDLGLTHKYVLNDECGDLLGEYEREEDVPKDTYVKNEDGVDVYVRSNQSDIYYIFDRSDDTENSQSKMYDVGQAVICTKINATGKYLELVGMTGVIVEVLGEDSSMDYGVLFPKYADRDSSVRDCTCDMMEDELEAYSPRVTTGTEVLAKQKETMIGKVSALYRDKLAINAELNAEIRLIKEQLWDKTMPYNEYINKKGRLELLEAEQKHVESTIHGISLAREELF